MRPYDTRTPNYALGWITVDDRQWARGRMLGHEGTNTMNHAYSALAPARGVAVIAFSNTGERGAAATQAVARGLIDTLG